MSSEKRIITSPSQILELIYSSADAAHFSTTLIQPEDAKCYFSDDKKQEPFDEVAGAVEDFSMKLIVASDHAGYHLKEHLKNQRKDIEWIDLGPQNTNSVDYPDYADLVAKKVIETNGMALLICGSGQGMCMRANKYSKIRAAMCWDTVTAKLAREHNNANILCIGGRLIPYGLVSEILDVFMKTPFSGGRHEKRVEKIGAPTK